jgi:transcription antitermination factor NusG
MHSKPDPQEWYVAYTFPHAEKKVQANLEKIGIHAYLPLHQVIRNWSDRRKKLLVPLFPNYIFVHTSSRQRHESFMVKEIIRYVSFDGRPATVRAAVINSLQNILKEKPEINIEEFVRAGSHVKIIKGPFLGTEGFLIRRNGNTRLLVQIDVLKQGISVNISIDDISPLAIEEGDIYFSSGPIQTIL